MKGSEMSDKIDETFSVEICRTKCRVWQKVADDKWVLIASGLDLYPATILAQALEASEKTNFTPRVIARQREELLAALQKAVADYGHEGGPWNVPSEPGTWLAIAKAALGHNTNGQLKSFTARIERLEEDKAAIGQDLKEVYSEAKAMGFDVKILRKVIRLRKIERAKRDEEEAMIDAYMNAIQGDLGI